MLRQTLLFLSERNDLKKVLFKLPYARGMAVRFVAGDTSEEALAVAKQLNDRGFRVTLDLLGESVLERAEAERAAAEYAESLADINAHEATTTISLKLTQLGLDIDTDFCYENLLGIVRQADELGNFVRIDMEDSEHTQTTLDVFYRVFEQYRNVGIVVQSYLYRSEDDIARLVELGAPVRLCKGAYKEPASVAFQDKREVDANFVRLMKMLLDGGAPTAIASHDERPIGRRVRDPDAVRREAGLPEAARGQRTQHANLPALRITMVLVLHAPHGGEAGEPVVRRASRVRRLTARRTSTW